MFSRMIPAFVAVLLVVVACEKKEDFESCPMTDKARADCDLSKIGDQCAGSSTSCYAACVVKDHPQCPEGPCLLYQYRVPSLASPYESPSFCTMGCDPTNYACLSDATKTCNPSAFQCLGGQVCDPQARQCGNGLKCTSSDQCTDNTQCEICQDLTACVPRCADHSQCAHVTCPTGAECSPFLVGPCPDGQTCPPYPVTGFCVPRAYIVPAQ